MWLWYIIIFLEIINKHTHAETHHKCIYYMWVHLIHYGNPLHTHKSKRCHKLIVGEILNDCFSGFYLPLT